MINDGPPEIEIPEATVAVMRVLCSLTHGDRSTLAEALLKATPTYSVDRLCKPIVAALPQLEHKVEPMVAVLLSFHRTLAQLNASSDLFANSLSEALRESDPGVPEPDGGWDAFASDLAHLLADTSSMRTVAKALELMSEQGQPIYGSRVLTDFRPIFEEDPSTRPTTGLILHTLRVQYLREKDEPAEIYIAMGRGDLLALRDSIDRALTKERTLSSVLASAGVVIVEDTDEAE